MDSTSANRLPRENLPFASMVFLACTVGVVTGGAAYVFKWLLSTVAGLFIPQIRAGEINWWIVVCPVAGILLTGIFTRYVIRTNLTHGCAQLINDFKNRTFRLRHNLVFSSIVGGTMTLGMGGSSGAEGPIAYTGGAIGSNLGQLLGLNDRDLKVLVACGAGAGIAAIFSAPVGGFMFVLEVMRVSLATLPWLAVMAACITAYLTIYTMTGFSPDLTFTTNMHVDTTMALMAVALGIFTGIYSIYYSGVVNTLDKFYKKIRNPWGANLTGGITLGIILLIFPSMFGVGYPVTGSVINGSFDALGKGSLLTALGLGHNALLWGAAGILLLKCWAVSSTNSSGGVGGDFAPTLFAGSMAGFLFATLCNNMFGMHLPVALFAYFGMAGVMAGAIHAPMMAIFIVIEMCQTYDLTLPVALTSIVSFLTVRGSVWARKATKPVIRHLNWF